MRACVCVLFLYCVMVLGVLYCLAIVLLRKRELVALLCAVAGRLLCLFLAKPWAGLQPVIEAFPGHTHLQFVVFDVYF